MKKIKICFLMICIICCIPMVSFAAKFYDTKDTVYEGIVDRIASLGIVNGMSENVYAPNKGITRGEIAKMIVYVRGLQDYADTMDLTITFSDTKSHWAKNYIQVANDLGLLKGYEDGTFKPDKEVSYAETIAIVLRMLGYSNISETSGSNWYSGYTKRMYEIRLDKGMPSIPSYTSSAKRGDVAILWWNMLISDSWAVAFEDEGTGLTYSYSKETQLEKMFPNATYIEGVVTSIANGDSGDTISIRINGRWYDTYSNVPLYSLGANGSGVYNKKEGILYGFSIDDDLEEYKIVSGPIFYLQEQGYRLNSAKTKYSYGAMNGATYAYLFVSKSDGRILRALYVNANDSVVVDSIKINYDEKDKDKNKKEEDEKKIGKIFLNGKNEEEELFTTTSAVVIVNGEKVEWDKIPSKAVLTTLIPDLLYTYETKSFQGQLTNYSNLDELYIDNDKYIVSNNCVYTVDGETESESKDLKEYNYSSMTSSRLTDLKSRGMVFYLNISEEIAKIEFGKYLAQNIEEKYTEGQYRPVYVQKILYPSGESYALVTGTAVNGKKANYQIEKSKNAFDLGELTVLEIEGKSKIKSSQLVDNNKTYGDDIRVIYHPEVQYENGAFGEYRVTNETLMFRIIREYEENSTEKVVNCVVNKLEGLENLGNLNSYDYTFICNDNLDIEVLYAEGTLNKTIYPIARVVSISKIKGSSGERANVNAKINILGQGVKTYNVMSGDCYEGELITFEQENDERISIKERYRTELIGFEKDMIVESYDKKYKKAKIKGEPGNLSLEENSYQRGTRTYHLSDYTYVFAEVERNSDTDNWTFVTAKLVEKEKIELRAKDRIVFDELNGIAVIYRGY